MKRTLPMSGLEAFSKTGHAINSEEPARFNAAVEHFFHPGIDRGHWAARGSEARLTEVWLPDNNNVA